MASVFPKKKQPPLLAREKLKPVTLLPSRFLNGKFCNVKKKASTGTSFLPRIGPFQHTSETSQKLSPAHLKKSFFQVSPPEIVFQNFNAHEASEMELSFINKDKFPRLVKVSMERSPYFELLCANDAFRVVPPGASSPVRIRFTPDENKDYSHELVYLTRTEQVVVPIRAIAARAILEFPEELDFLECPVKYSTQKTLLLRNVGNLEAPFQLSTQSPFFVVPASGTLGAGDTMQVTVGFHPLTTGDHSGSLEVCCNTGGKSIHTNLHGKAVDVAIELSTNSVKFGKTFITTSTSTTMLIKNRSNITAHFQWKTFPTEENEIEQKRRQCYLLQPLEEVALKNLIEEENAEQEIAKVQEDPMLFSDDIFSIEPMEGEIRPNSCAKIKVTFKPLEELEYRSVAYCNISGRESRLPLRLRGEGQGPFVELSNHTLNLGNMLLNTPYVYEVKLINQAAIDAPFTYIHTTANVGYCFKFAPEKGTIAPGGIQIIQISFSADTLGSFEEQFQFIVAGSPTSAILTITGFVTRPTVHFDVNELDFGDISFGFPYTKTCRLSNPSPVSLPFKLRMSDDGTQPAVNCFDQIRKPNDPSWRDGIHFYVEPREFTVNPSQGTIPPWGEQDIEVTLCSQTVMEFYRRLLVDLEGIGNEMATLIISARCLVPELRVYPHVLLYDECRRKVPYERKFLVVNDTDLPGCYGLIPQKRKEDTPVFYSSPKPCGIVQPHSTAEIPVVIEVQTLGEHHTSVLIGVFGDERNPRRQELRSTGQLADIYPSPRLIEFGMIPALQPNSQIFTLFSDSPVSTDFRIEIAHKPQFYAIEPREGEIPAMGEVPVTITATLDDTGLFADTIQLFIGNSLWTAFALVAMGTGTAIAIDKPFMPELNLGYQFSLVPCIRQFIVTNRGHDFHRLSWSVVCHSPPEKEGQSLSDLSSPKAEVDCQSPKRTRPVFELQPLTMELQPGESADLVLQGFSRIVQEVQDYGTCEAVIGTVSRIERILETTITCKFIDPSIEVSARKFSFRVERKPSDVLALQYKPLSLKNTCSLPLDLVLDVEQPFLVCDVDKQPLPDDQPVTLDVGQTCHLYIAFNPAYAPDFHSWKVKKMLKIKMANGHPYVEYISLLGEAHFPSLQIQPITLEFGCILAGTEKVRSLEMTNCSRLPVEYHWSFHPDSQVNRLRYERFPLKFKPQPPEKKRTSLDCSASQGRRFKIRNGEDPGTALRESRDPAQSLGAEVLPSTSEKYYIPLGLGGFRLSTDIACTPLEVEKAFSILPQWGVLQPGERQRVSFTFSGHPDTVASATALCHVEGGPTYQVGVTGEASRISYSLSQWEISCGFQMFNEIHHSTVVLANTGKIKFDWVLNLSITEQHLPGVFLVKPTHGSIAPGEREVLKFSYMPGIPGAFSRTFQLKVGDLDPENICLKGEAFFPMITVDLPWNIEGNEKFEELIKPLQQYSQRRISAVQKKTQSWKSGTLRTRNQKPRMPGSGIVSSTQLQIEIVMKLVKEPALELQEKLPSHPPRSRFPEKELCQSLVKVELPEYVLDMGPVRRGYTERRTLAISNPGHIPVSFQVDVSALQDTGFRVNLDQIQELPHRQTVMIEVCFENTHQPRGDVDVLLPIEVAKGPTYNIRLRATVLKLSLNLSKSTLEFSDILVGQCQTETVRLYNWFPVPCKWFIKAIEPVMKDNERQCWTPGQKQQAPEDEPCPFAVTPSKGTLDAGRWQNLQIQFTPKEERSYKNELKLSICGSRHHLKLHLSGQGLEPRLEFSPPALKMGWVLVDSEGVDATVAVKNPCNFPFEFYSLDFDEQYLEEEFLRMAVRSEYQKNFLMPPRAVGGTLPPEVLEDYEAQKRPKAQQAELKAMAEAMAMDEAEAMDKAAPAYDRAVTSSPEPMVKVTGNPVSWAVMRHLGIDPSSERREAQQDRGIVLLVHGPSRAGNTEVAAALCHYYDTAHLSIDTVVKEAIASDQSQAGCQARELCTEAAMEPKSEDGGNAGKKPQLTAQTKNKQASGKKNSKKNAKGKNPSAQKKEPASKPNRKDTKFTDSTGPAPQQLSIISSHGEELNCLSCVLPEDLLVDILCERLKREDCYKGVVFDGLESLFASSLESSLLCLLQAVKNRCHIYMVNLHQNYDSWITKEEAEREKEELQWKKPIQRSTECVLQMNEDEDDALLEKKALVDKILMERKRMQSERELKWLAQKLEEEAKAFEEEVKKEEKDVSLGKQPAKPEKKESKILGTKRTKILEKGKYKASKMWEIIISEKKGTKSPEKKKIKILEREEPIIPETWKYKAPEMWKIVISEKKGTKSPEKKKIKILEREEPIIPETWKYKAPEKEEPEAPEEEPKAPEKEEPKAPEKGETEIPEYSAEMEKRFQIYESSQQDVTQVFSYSGRVQGTVQLPVIQNGNTSQPSDENKGQKTSKPQEKVEKKPEQNSGGQWSLQSSQLETQSEVAEGAVRDEHVGMPCLDIQVTNPKVMIREILRDGRLPTKDEMLRYLGLHPEGPPLPPAAVLSIVDYPEELGSAECVKPFTIAAPEGAAMEHSLVSDTENILGIAQAENIKISAEVCDVSLSIDMPEGQGGSLEFGTINVLDVVVKVLTLKNKGIYNIEYRFMLEGAGTRMQDLASHFTIEPQSGTLIASQPGVNVDVLFHPTREMLLKNKPILYCQVMDASSGEGGQAVTTIPVRVSAAAVYSKFSIEPGSSINFGAMVKGTKKTQIVVLENKGMLSFKFHIHQAPEDASALESESSKQEESSPLATKLKSSSSQDHLTVGMFTVSPCSGSITPWGQQDITVDCLAGQEGTCEEQLYIDITGRDPRDNPLGIPFTLAAESCLPEMVEDVTLAFEEHPIHSSTNFSCKLWSAKGVGLYARDENKFIFTKVLVRQEAEAHISIYNATGLPCDAFLCVKPLPGRAKSPIDNIFKVYPARISIPSSSNGIATVTFTPPDKQSYSCIFKASLVIPKSSVESKSQVLIFAISGKGYEPQVTVVCPSARSKRGNAVLRFKRLQVGDSEMLPLVMCNKGIVPVKFMLNLEDEHGAFSLKGTLKKFYTEDVEDVCIGNESKPPGKPFLLLHQGQSRKFEVIFKPTLAQRLEGKIRVLVGDIYSNKTLIELVGEGHKDEFTLDGLEEDTEERNADSSLNKDIIDAVRVNHIQFGECPVGKPCHRTFTITNHTHKQAMRFEWEADATFRFSPKTGHLLPGCTKDITVTLKADVPAIFRRHLVKCKVTKINIARPRRKVQDWNDQMSIVTWKDTSGKDPAASWPEKEKVVETAPEPAYTAEEESIQEAEVYLSASVVYTQLKLNTIVVQLKDTAPNQTRTATFRMHNRGNVALEYTWVEAPDSETEKRLHSTTLTCPLLSSSPLRHEKKLHPFWWQQEHPFETHPSGLQQLAKQQQDSEQQQQQQDSEQQQQQDSEQHLQQDSEQQLQQDSEQQQQDSQQQLQQDSQQQLQQDSQQQLQQDSEQQQQLQQDSEQLQQQQDSEQQLQQDSEQLQQQQDSEQLQQQQDSEQLQQQQDSEQQQQQDSEQLQQDSEQQEQDSEQQQQQDSEQQDYSKELHQSEQLHLSLQCVSSSLETYTDIIQDLPLFFINPYHGIMAPGQKQIFDVVFSPKHAGKFRTTVLFRPSDLKPSLKTAEVIVEGTAQEPQCLDEPKHSVLRQTQKGQGPKKRVHWKPTLLEFLC